MEVVLVVGRQGGWTQVCRLRVGVRMGVVVVVEVRSSGSIRATLVHWVGVRRRSLVGVVREMGRFKHR